MPDRPDSRPSPRHHHHGAHPHVFDPARAAALDDPRRSALMPPGALVAALRLAAGERVADIGCGGGYWLLPLLAAAPDGAHFWAVDRSPEMLDHLRERLRGHARAAAVTLLRSPDDALPLPDAALDVAVLGAVYHELPDRPAWLRELTRVLAPGGRLAIIDWDALAPGRERTMGPPVADRVPVEQAVRELAAAGFGPIERLEGFREAYALVARRPA